MPDGEMPAPGGWNRIQITVDDLEAVVRELLDAEASRMAGDNLEFYPEDLRTYGASLNALWRLEGAGYMPYLLVGAGGYRLQRVGAEPNVYGTTPALQAGVGVEVEVGISAATALVFEMRATAHLTDYYASSEFAPTVFRPVMAGLRWARP